MDRKDLTPEQLSEFEKRLLYTVHDENGVKLYINGRLLVRYMCMTLAALIFLLYINRQWIDVFRRIWAGKSALAFLPLESGFTTGLWIISTVVGAVTIVRLFHLGHPIYGGLIMGIRSFFWLPVMYVFPFTLLLNTIGYVWHRHRKQNEESGKEADDLPF